MAYFHSSYISFGRGNGIKKVLGTEKSLPGDFLSKLNAVVFSFDSCAYSV